MFRASLTGSMVMPAELDKDAAKHINEAQRLLAQL